MQKKILNVIYEPLQYVSNADMQFKTIKIFKSTIKYTLSP